MNRIFVAYNFFILAIPFLLSFNVFAEKQEGRNEERQSYISVQGTSNVNEFTLINQHPIPDDEYNGIEDSGNYLNVLISVNEFSSENKRMVNDFRQMLQESKYPYIKIGIEPIEFADFEETTGLTEFSLIITIAGKTNKYNVPCEVFSKLNSGYTITGSFSVKLTDFNIDPPEKLLGLIKVNNEVFINFLFKFDSEEVLTEKITF